MDISFSKSYLVLTHRATRTHCWLPNWRRGSSKHYLLLVMAPCSDGRERVQSSSHWAVRVMECHGSVNEVLDLNKSAVQEGNILRGKVRFRVLYDTRLENPATASLLADCSCLSITETGGSARQCLERNIIPILLRSIFVDSPKLPSHSQHCFCRSRRRGAQHPG